MLGKESFLRNWVYFVARFFVTRFYRLWFGIEWFGVENVPATGGCLIASNHVSFLDPPAVGLCVRHRVVHFLARSTLFKGVLRRWLLLSLHAVPIDRDRGDVGALRKALEILQEGKVLVLFPEGTRSPTGELQPAKPGIGFLISKARVPVVPVYVDGTFEALPKGAKRLRRHKIRVFFGAPITVAEVEAMGTSRGSYESIANLVMQRIAQLRDRARAHRATAAG